MTTLQLRESSDRQPSGRGLVVMAVVLACIGLSPAVRAVSPAPDGGYAGNNTAEGANALNSLTSGANNTADGFAALLSLTSGNNNTANGVNALYFNTTGSQNTASGFAALEHNTTASYNTASGQGALFSNTTGLYNTADGAQALFSNTTGGDNTAEGLNALFNNTTGGDNTAIGFLALISNTTANQNVAVGSFALVNNTTGDGNVAIGYQALSSHTTVGINDSDGTSVAIGYQALQNENGGFDSDNNAVGFRALQANTTGEFNNAFGWRSLNSNTTGSSNAGFGDGSCDNVTTASNVTCLGAGVSGENVSGTTWIANVYSVTTQSGTTLPVIVSDGGQLGTLASSARFKKDITPMDQNSEAILRFNPVTFHYKSDTTATPQFGLVAEEVEKINPDLVVKDKEGKVFTVRYDAVNVMLLNEFLKAHRALQVLKSTVAKQEATIAQQQKGMEVLTATLKEQASQIQKVSAQVELSKPAPQVVDNNQ
jgi:hypothetical protein